MWHFRLLPKCITCNCYRSWRFCVPCFLWHLLGVRVQQCMRAWAPLYCLRALYEKVFPFISFRFVAFHFPVLLFIMQHGVSCFYLNFAACCAKSSLIMMFRSFCRQIWNKKKWTSLTTEYFILLGRSFASMQWLRCICDLTLVNFPWIRFSFSKQKICDLFLKWCILFQLNFAPCCPFCSFVYLLTMLQVYKWTKLQIS